MTTVSQELLNLKNDMADENTYQGEKHYKQKQITLNGITKHKIWNKYQSSQRLRKNCNEKLYYKKKKNNFHIHLIPIEMSECPVPQNENKIEQVKSNVESTDVGYNEQKKPIKTNDFQKKKTPMTILNEWSMCFGEKKSVSYILVAIAGSAHKPIYTYVCQADDITGKGEGRSKKEAKQNAAAELLEKLFQNNSTTDSDKIITSTTDTENITNENTTVHLPNNETEGIQTSNEFDSKTNYENLQHTKYGAVQMAYCDINPIGALQELSTTNKWAAPFYSFEKLFHLNKNQPRHRRNSILFKVTCQIFHLQTTGMANTKRAAKRIAARLMIDMVLRVGIEKLKKLKSITSEVILPNKNCEEKGLQKTYEKLYQEWTIAYNFHSYFTTAINVSIETSPSYTLIKHGDSLNSQSDQQLKREQHQMELEQSIIEYDKNMSIADQLQNLSRQLGFHVIYVSINDFVSNGQQKKDINTSTQEEEYAVLVQVSTIPIIVTVGCATTVDKALEIAAKQILHTFREMLITSILPKPSLNNNGLEQNLMDNK